jgi:hypothetical protein
MGLLRKSETTNMYTGSSPATKVENLTVGAQNTRSSDLSARLKLPNHLRIICCSEKWRRKRQRHWRQHHNKRSDASSYAHCHAHNHITDTNVAIEREGKRDFANRQRVYENQNLSTPDCNRVAANIRSPHSFILVHVFTEGPLKRCNSF